MVGDAAGNPGGGRPGTVRRTRRRRLLALRVLAGTALLAGAGLVGLGLRIDAYGQADHAQAADAIVVLGSRVLPGGAAGDSLRARTLQAVALYRRGLAPALICTGGVGKNPPAEAEVATALAVSEGVPESAILREATSTSTRGNALNAAAICREHRWSRVIVVSDPYHLWRARREFEAAGLVAYPSPALACERNRKTGLRLYWTAREVGLVVRDALLPHR